MKSLKIPLTVSQAKAIVWLILGTVWCLYVTSTIYSYAHQGTVISTYYDTETGAFHLPPIVIFVQGNSPTAPNIGFNWVGDTTNYATTVSVSPGGSTDPLKSVFEVSTLIKPCTRAPTINCTFVQLDPTETGRIRSEPFQLMMYTSSDITLSIQASIFGSRYIDPRFSENVQYPSSDPEDLLNIPRLAKRPNILQTSAGGVGNVQNLQLTMVQYTEYPGPWASFWPDFISKRIQEPRTEYFYQLYSTSSFTGLNVDRGNNGNLTAIILNSGPRYTIVQKEIGTQKATDIINSISAPFGPITSLLTICFGLGMYRTHGLFQQRLLSPRKWVSSQYTIVTNSVSSPDKVSFAELEERVRALEGFRTLLRQEILHIDKHLLRRQSQAVGVANVTLSQSQGTIKFPMPDIQNVPPATTK